MPPADNNAMLTVRDLRRRWKPTNERLAASAEHERIRIRIHRACSWLQRVEDLGDNAALDAVLLYRWIAFNSLYGRWNESANEPEPHWLGVRSFAIRIGELDKDGHLPAMLETHRKLVMAIFEEEYLTRFFWEDPSDGRARKSQKTKFDARTWYIENRHSMILERVLERLDFRRCQLVHGAATFGGALNRTAVNRCGIMLGQLLPAVLLVIIDHGHDEDPRQGR